MARKIKKAIEETVVEVVTEVKEEANEEVGTYAVKRWQVVVAAVVVTALIIGVAL